METNHPPVSFEQLFPESTQLLRQILSRLDTIEEQRAGNKAGTSKPLTTKQLCEHLNITEPTVIRYRRKGWIPFFKIGDSVRFDLDKVLAALESRKKK